MNELTHLDIFSGFGGFVIAGQWAGFRTVGVSEIDPYACSVIAKHWPDIINFGDVRNVPRTPCDLLTGGEPCQPNSLAGKRRGKKDDRYLWPEMLRVIEESRPTWVVNENVTGSISNMVLDQKIADLEARDYSCRAFIIPACAVNAWHRRERVWLVAHSERVQQSREEPRNGTAGRMGRQFQPVSWDRDWQSALREFRGMDDGLSYGVERLDGLRNAIVPQVAFEILNAISNIQR